MQYHLEPTVFIIDDDEAVRDSLAMLVRSAGQAVEVFDSPEKFLKIYDEQRTGCILLDVKMPGTSGLELLSILQEMRCALPVIMLTGHGDVPMAVQALKNGAMHFIQKPPRNRELIDLIHEALERNSKQRTEQREHQEILNRLATLTAREWDVLYLIVQGKPNKVIAHDFQRSQRTIEVHRANIMEKMGTKSVANLVSQVMRVRDQLSVPAPQKPITDTSPTSERGS